LTTKDQLPASSTVAAPISTPPMIICTSPPGWPVPTICTSSLTVGWACVTTQEGWTGVAVGSSVLVAVAVAVFVAVGSGVLVGLGVTVAVGCGRAVAVGAGVAVSVGSGVAVDVAVAVATTACTEAAETMPYCAANTLTSYSPGSAKVTGTCHWPFGSTVVVPAVKPLINTLIVAPG